MAIPQYRHPDETYKALWGWQKANPNQPITPALVDRCIELGMDGFAAVLDLCRVRGWRPAPGYNGGWSWVSTPRLFAALFRHLASHRTLYVSYAADLCGCYAKLLHVPYKELETL